MIERFTGATALAAALSLAVVLLLALVGRPAARRDLPAISSVLLFVMLTQYPWPDPATLSCPMPLTGPSYMPGNSLWHLRSQIRAWGLEVALFKDATVIAAAMNYLLCLLIGLALAWQGRLSGRAILLFGAAMTITIELTQLTGTWGLYPCAYRKFDADDLVLNFLGVLSGLWLGRRRGWHRRAALPTQGLTSGE